MSKYDQNNGNDIALPGTVWICGACGKRARDRISGRISYGWDESCYMWAILCRDDIGDDTKRGRASRVPAVHAGTHSIENVWGGKIDEGKR